MAPVCFSTEALAAAPAEKWGREKSADSIFFDAGDEDLLGLLPTAS
jgi:hypothetical protein